MNKNDEEKGKSHENQFHDENESKMNGWQKLQQMPSLWVSLQALNSVSLTILNKKLTILFPFPFVVLACQNLISVVLFAFFNYYSILPMKKPTAKQLIIFLPTTIFYILILWSSLEGLRRVSVTLVTIARNFVPLLTAFIETTLFGLKLSGDSYIALFIIFIGSVLYGVSDTSVDFDGLGYLTLNLLAIVLVPILEKRLLANMKNEQTPTGITFIRNILSIPMLIALSLLMNDMGKVMSSFNQNRDTVLAYLGATSIFGFSIGVTYFFMLNLISNTSVAICNTCYKLLAVPVSWIFFDVPFFLHGSVGMILSFGGIFWYTYIQNVERVGNPSTLIVQPADISKEEEERVQKRKLYIRSVSLLATGFSVILYFYLRNLPLNV